MVRKILKPSKVRATVRVLVLNVNRGHGDALNVLGVVIEVRAFKVFILKPVSLSSQYAKRILITIDNKVPIGNIFALHIQ